MYQARTLNPLQTKRLVIGIAIVGVILTTGSVLWGLAHPTPKSLQVLSPAHTPGGPATVQAIVTVEGMTCEGCAASITSSIKEMGADSVTVDLKTKLATVVFRTDKLSVSDIFNKIQELGYTPKLLE